MFSSKSQQTGSSSGNGSGFSFGNGSNSNNGFSFGNTNNNNNNGSTNNGFSFGKSTSGISSGNSNSMSLGNGSGMSLGNGSSLGNGAKPALGSGLGSSTAGNALFNNSKPSIFGNSATTGQTTANALGNGLTGSGFHFGPANGTNNNPASTNSTSSPYTADLSSMAAKMTDMPRALTQARSTLGGPSSGKRKRSSSVVSGPENADYVRDASIPSLGRIGHSFARDAVENVSGLFSSPVHAAFPRENGTQNNQRQAEGGMEKYASLHHISVQRSEYRRLVITHARDAYKDYSRIDPNKVILKSMSVSTGSGARAVDFRPPSKKARVGGKDESDNFEFVPTIVVREDEVDGKHGKEEKREIDGNGIDGRHEMKEKLKTDGKQNKQPSKLKPPTGYWCTPSLNELAKMNVSQLASVKDFSVGRKGSGQMMFRSPVDLTEFEGRWNELLGDAIVFKNKLICVYKTDEEKPEPGNGLNVPATVSISGCYPKDAKTKKQITDPDYPGLPKHIELLRSYCGMEFVNYDALTGTFTFNVEHFSIWGMVDEQEDEPADVQRFQRQQQRERVLQGEAEERQRRALEKVQGVEEEMWEREEEKKEENKDKDKEDNTFAPSSIISNDHFFDAHSLSDPGSSEDDFGSVIDTKAYEPEINNKEMLAISSAPQYAVAGTWDDQIRLASGFHSVFNDNLEDADGMQLDKTNVNRVLFDNDKPKSCLSNNKPVQKPAFAQAPAFARFLKLEKAQNTFQARPDGQVPLVGFDTTPSLRTALDAFGQCSQYEGWHLLAILFDNEYCFSHLPDLDARLCQTQPLLRPRLEELKRRELLCRWLADLCTPGLEHKMATTSSKLDTVFYLTCLGKVGEAVQAAIRGGNPDLAVLISMMDSNDQTVKNLARDQLDDWSKSGSLQLIPAPVVKMYKLLAGMVLSDSYIDHLLGLSWPVVLLLLLQYGDTNLPLSDVIRDFVGYLETHDLAPVDGPQSTITYYRLVKMFMEPAQTLCKFDLQTQFALVKKLNVFLSLDVRSADEICRQFAHKLVENAMYEDAIFVCEHLSLEKDCTDEITAIIDAHIDRMGFLNDAATLDRLNRSLHLSRDLLNRARATRFSAKSEFESATRALIAAHSLEEAHSLAIQHVAPQYIIQESHLDRLQQLLGHFASVPGWSTGGAIYSDYCTLGKYSGAGNVHGISQLVPRLLNELSLLKELNFSVKVAKTLMYKRLIGTAFKFHIDVANSQLLALELPPSETNYLKNKLSKEGGPKLLM